MLAGEAKALHTTKRSSGVDVSDPALADAWARVRQDSEDQTNWCAFAHAEVNDVWRRDCHVFLSCFSSSLYTRIHRHATNRGRIEEYNQQPAVSLVRWLMLNRRRYVDMVYNDFTGNQTPQLAYYARTPTLPHDYESDMAW